jgi:glycosyltransferase involved in cell wall biosynthesis
VSGKAYLALERLLEPRGNLYLFESAFSAEVFAAKIGKPKNLVRVVHNGVSRPEFEPIPLAADATDIIFLGELRTVKGIDVLLDAIAHLRRHGTPLTATLVGGGALESELRAQAESLGLGQSIRFLPPMQARAAMALGRLMVIPSRAESLPYVVLEAAAAGKPLITTHVGGIPEIYGPLSPTLIPAGDPLKLAEAIARALREPEVLADTTRLVRQRVADSFSVETMVDSVIAAYEQALSRGPAHDNAAVAHA